MTYCARESENCGNMINEAEIPKGAIDICTIRFHHRLVSIHPFPNRNGRHSRLVADLLMIFSGESPFSWGGASIDFEGNTRTNYLNALRSADKGNYELLIEFANQD